MSIKLKPHPLSKSISTRPGRRTTGLFVIGLLILILLSGAAPVISGYSAEEELNSNQIRAVQNSLGKVPQIAETPATLITPSPGLEALPEEHQQADPLEPEPTRTRRPTATPRPTPPPADISKNRMMIGFGVIAVVVVIVGVWINRRDTSR